MLNKCIKKYWWVFLLVIYVFTIAYRFLKSGFDVAIIGLIIATIQLLVQNAELAKRYVLMIYFWLIDIQFRWKYIAEFKLPESSAKNIDEKYFKKLILSILKDYNNLKNLKDEVESYSRKNGSEILITFMPLGINIVVTKAYGDFTDDLGEDIDEKIIYIKVVGDAHVKYRQTKKVLDEFITSLFSGLENNLQDILHRKFILQIESGEQDNDYFKKLFIKGIESDEVKKFSLSKKPGRYTLNASEKSIYIYCIVPL